MGEKSLKTIKNLSELVGSKKFRIPREFGDTYNQDRKLCIGIQIGGSKWLIPVDEATEIPYEPFCVLKDSGLLSRMVSEDGEEFNPL